MRTRSCPSDKLLRVCMDLGTGKRPRRFKEMQLRKIWQDMPNDTNVYIG
jgi:hypothetical protein